MGQAADTLTKPLGAGHEMTLERIFDAPPELVFDCFTDPAHLARWWGPLECRNDILTLDARPGGEISLRMAGPGYDHIMGGQFVEIERPRRLVFLTKAFAAPDGGWGMINRNTLVFEPVDGATRLILHTRVERAEGDLVLGALSGMKAGWGQSLERLGDLVGGGGKMDIEIGDRRIVLTRAFDAPPERLWQALTDADLFARWFAGGSGVVEAMDVRPGGLWGLTQEGPDGAEHRFWGEFLQVDPQSRLVMTQGFDVYPAIEVTLTLGREWGRTVLTRVMNFPDNAYRDGMLGSSLERSSARSYDGLARILAQ